MVCKGTSSSIEYIYARRDAFHTIQFLGFVSIKQETYKQIMNAIRIFNGEEEREIRAELHSESWSEFKNALKNRMSFDVGGRQRKTSAWEK